MRTELTTPQKTDTALRTELTTPRKTDSTMRTELTTRSGTDTTPTRMVTGGFGRASRRAAAGEDMFWKEDRASALWDNGLGQMKERRDGAAGGSEEEEDGRLGGEERPSYGDPAAVSPASLRSRTAAAGRATIG